MAILHYARMCFKEEKAHKRLEMRGEREASNDAIRNHLCTWQDTLGRAIEAKAQADVIVLLQLWTCTSEVGISVIGPYYISSGSYSGIRSLIIPLGCRVPLLVPSHGHTQNQPPLASTVIH